jgi:hypothetical protein
VCWLCVAVLICCCAAVLMCCCVAALLHSCVATLICPYCYVQHKLWYHIPLENIRCVTMWLTSCHVASWSHCIPHHLQQARSVVASSVAQSLTVPSGQTLSIFRGQGLKKVRYIMPTGAGRRVAGGLGSPPDPRLFKIRSYWSISNPIDRWGGRDRIAASAGAAGGIP